MELRGSNALLTGASGGIGRHIAAGLARRGVNLVVSGRDRDRLDAALSAARAHGVTAEAIPAELDAEGGPQRLAEQAEAALGSIDLLVNNAGIETIGAFTSHAPEEIERTIAVNVTAPMLLTHAVLPGMLERGRGHVVNMSSIAGKSGVSHAAVYGPSKLALVPFTRALRQEHRGSGVGFSAICPGFVSGEGMYGEFASQVGRAPALLAPVPVEAVVDAIIAAVERDAPERIVTRLPVRPVFAIEELAPRLGARLTRLAGGNAYFAKVARTRGRS